MDVSTDIYIYKTCMHHLENIDSFQAGMKH